MITHVAITAPHHPLYGRRFELISLASLRDPASVTIALGEDLPRVWHATTTTAAERKIIWLRRSSAVHAIVVVLWSGSTESGVDDPCVQSERKQVQGQALRADEYYPKITLDLSKYQWYQETIGRLVVSRAARPCVADWLKS